MLGTTIVFDLDGTLVDTAPDLVATLNLVFDREGIAQIPYAAARNMIGGGAKRMLERGLRERGLSGAQADLDRLYATVKAQKGQIDVLFANAGGGEFAPLGAITIFRPAVAPLPSIAR